ncbi:hypothetical protein LCGC14_1042770 [marine sediment metagenome]|uniref:DNA adenine methylase n=2 Tax=root TaxID=1 RepID=A0A831QMU4_9FLAO|nr:DNA adenine methylase [Pricia antarctica]
MSHNSNKLIAFNYFGGKFTWLDHLYRMFPKDFNHLVDVFAGSMSVSLNYKGKIVRTANEINEDITNFFEVLRTDPEELVRLLELTPCSELEYSRCWEISEDKMERARRYYVRLRMSFFGLGAQKESKSMHLTKTHVNADGGEVVSKLRNAVPKLMDVAKEIRNNFQIVNCDYSECIERFDFKDAFFYCDPPYSKRSRASFNDYKFEFTDEDHKRLAFQLHNIEGKAMVSGYDCSLMNELYSDFTKIKFPVKKNNIRSSDVQEVVWINYPIEKTASYVLNLFTNKSMA